MHTITAEAVLLALVARKANPRCRWAALSAHTVTQPCGYRHGSYRIESPSNLSPMHRGDFERSLERLRLRGRREVIRTFGSGIRAMRAEAARHVLEA